MDYNENKKVNNPIVFDFCAKDQPNRSWLKKIIENNNKVFGGARNQKTVKLHFLNFKVISLNEIKENLS
jgi:hypothetical protein